MRFHGAGEVSIDDYVRSIDGPVDVLITEGTRVGSDEILTEQDVGEEISADIGRSEGLVLINFGWKDLTRFNTVYEAAKEKNGHLRFRQSLLTCSLKCTSVFQLNMRTHEQ